MRAGGPCRVFVTSTPFGGILGGLTAADKLCQDYADSANLRGTYKAWLLDSTASPSTRSVQSTGPYQLGDGTQTAANWTKLTDGSLRAPINLDENENTVDAAAMVWIHTQFDGTAGASGDHGGNWGAATGFGGHGSAAYMDANRAQRGSAACNSGLYLYCFQQGGR